MTGLKERLLRVLQQADEPMDYLDLIAATRMPGATVVDHLHGLEEEGTIQRHMGEFGVMWTYDPGTA